MAKAWKWLIFIYFAIFASKLILAAFIQAPSALSDDYMYVKIAQSFHDSLTLSIHDVPSKLYPPLYSIILSISYIFKDMRTAYFVMKLINALISSLIMFPAYLLAREFMQEKKSILVSIVVALLPSSFAFSGYVMAENLFYPLFLFSVYFVYKSFTSKSYIWDALAGLSIGLAFLTRSLGIVLLFVIASILLIRLFLRDNIFLEIKKKSLMAVIFAVTMLPWFLRNSLIYGFGINSVLGGYSTHLSGGGRITENLGALLPFLSWILVYAGYIILASGILFFVFSIFCLKQASIKRKNLFTLMLIIVFSLIFTILLASYFSATANISTELLYKTFLPWLTGRIMGRYIDHVLPLIIIGGFIGFSFYKDKQKDLVKYILYVLPFAVFSLQSIFFPLFPVNNISLVHLGVLKYALDYLLYHNVGVFSYAVFFVLSLLTLIFASAFIIFSIFDRITLKNLFLYSSLFFLIVSILAFSVNYYNSNKYWYSSDQMQMGLWINYNIRERSVFLIDMRDQGKIEKLNQNSTYELFADGSFASTVDFWINQKVIIGDVNNLSGVDYIISRSKLDLVLVKEVGSIYIYKA